MRKTGPKAIRRAGEVRPGPPHTGGSESTSLVFPRPVSTRSWHCAETVADKCVGFPQRGERRRWMAVVRAGLTNRAERCDIAPRRGIRPFRSNGWFGVGKSSVALAGKRAASPSSMPT